MAAFIIFVVLVIWVIVAGGAAGRKVRRLERLQFRGVRGRGLVLSSPFLNQGITTTINGQRYEKRTLTLDVEIPEREPYVSSGDFLIPCGLVEPVPGASLDVAVDPRNKNLIAVLGPGGFSGPWLRVGVPAAY